MKIVFLSHLDMNLYLFRMPIMQSLVQRGHQVVALVPRGDYFDQFKEYGIEAVEYEIDRGSLNPLKELKTIRRIAQKFKELQPHIIHTFTIKPNIYGSIAAKMAGIPFVINSVTGLGSFYIEESTKAKTLRFVIETLNRIAFKIAKKVIFQNQDDLNLYLQKGILKESKAALIKGSGVDTHFFSQEQVSIQTREEYIKTLNLQANSIVILMVARAIVHKGIKEYYLAAKKLKEKNPHWVFLFVGDVDKGNISAIQQEFLESERQVQWLGKRKDIRELIAICDIFVLPSYREGIPRTLLEAGSMSKPIITTNAVGCKEVVDDKKNGFLVPVGNDEALAEKISILAEDSALRQKFSLASRQKIQEEFSQESIVKLHLEIYQEVYQD
ncbi:galactosyltransferase [Helicobacter monodelphidis]|uniref:glycosyltransferase family 4 protein n=1 Tax=Helicobacter sp. 15-1451 TaxID=2004995 RepID=UPI000DCC1987|nr:glycosyltransferase family 4 protein [Helicobacter sp. 15-1451]RAX56711.1 galactosyltransferase [Helicobacter sp. 15-1451]